MHHPPRLRRLDRYHFSAPVLFLTACTSQRRPILARPAVHRAFRQFAELARPRGIDVGRYVVMPDHLHWFVQLGPSSPNLATWIKSLKNALSKTLREQQVSSPHWQKGFFDHVLRTQESYEEKWQYVVRNPVRKGLVICWEQWPYSGEICELDLRRS